MLFTNLKTNLHHGRHLKIGNNPILQVNHKLKWDKHIEALAKRISKSYFILNRVKHSLNRKHLRILYYSIVHPHLIYGLPIWGNTYQVHLSRIIILQKKIIRTITGAQYDAHSEPLFKSVNILKLQDLYKLQTSKYVMKSINNTLPLALNSIFIYTRNIHQQTRQHKFYKLIQPRARINVITRSILNMGPKIWNEIDPSLYMNETKTYVISISGFVSRFKRHLLNNYSD